MAAGQCLYCGTYSAPVGGGSAPTCCLQSVYKYKEEKEARCYAILHAKSSDKVSERYRQGNYEGFESQRMLDFEQRTCGLTI